MSVSTTVPGTEFLPMVNGRAWEFTHNDYAYQMVCVNGTDTIKMWYRPFGSTEWTFGHARSLNGQGAAFVARQMRAHVTAGS